MSSPSPVPPANQTPLIKGPAEAITEAHHSLNVAAFLLAGVVKELSQQTPNIPELKANLTDAITTTAEAAKILSLTYPKIKE